MLKYYKTQVGNDTVLMGEMTIPDMLGNEVVCKGESNLSELERAIVAGNDPVVLMGFSFGGALKGLKKIAKKVDPVKLVKQAPKIAEAIGKKEVLSKALTAAKASPLGAKLGIAVATINAVKAGSPQAKKTVQNVEAQAKAGNETAKTDLQALTVAKDLVQETEAHNAEVDQIQQERKDRNAAIYRSRYLHGARAGFGE